MKQYPGSVEKTSRLRSRNAVSLRTPALGVITGWQLTPGGNINNTLNFRELPGYVASTNSGVMCSADGVGITIGRADAVGCFNEKWEYNDLGSGGCFDASL